MRKYRIVFISLLMLVSFVDSKAYNIRQITNKDGLSNSAVLSMYQDKEGFMWIGTCDGLNVSNGANISVFKPAIGKDNLAGNLIADIAEASVDELWVHTNYGLNRLNKKNRKISTYNKFSGRYIYRKNKTHMFVLQADNTISCYDKGNDNFVNVTPKGLLYENILNMVVDDNGFLWLFSKNGKDEKYKITDRTDGSVDLQRQNMDDSEYRNISCLMERENINMVYLIDERGRLYRYDLIGNKKEFIFDLKDEIAKRGNVSSITGFGKDYFVGFKTDGAVRLMSGGEGRDASSKANYTVQDLGIKVGVFYLLKDRFQDLVWIGTDGQGIYMYSQEPYSIRSSTFDGLVFKIEKPVRAIFLDRDNTLWVGTKGNGILKVFNYEKNKHLVDCRVEYVTSSNSQLMNDAVYSIGGSAKDIIWIGTETGLNYYSYHDKRIKKIEIDVQGEPAKFIHSITEVGDSCLWLATVGTGIVKVDVGWRNNEPYVRKSQRILIGDRSFSDNLFFTSFVDKKKNVWFGNRGLGAFYSTPNRPELHSVLLDRENKLRTLNDVFSITEDHKGNLWFGTSYGLVKYTEKGEFEYFNEYDGLSNNTIHGVVEDSQKNLWLSTNTGIVKFSTSTKTFQTYDYKIGLDVSEYSDGAYFRDERTRTMFFGGINGFTSVSETDYEPTDFFPAINFYSISIYGQECSIYDFMEIKGGEKRLNLDYTQKNFTLYCSAIDYLNANSHAYKYMLKGEDSQWTDVQNSNGIPFTNMSPGVYVLQVKYLNSYTGKESPVETLIIRIHPPWYSSMWAYLVYFLLGIGLAFYLMKRFSARIEKKRQAMLEKLEVRHKEKVYESKLQFFINIAQEFCAPLTLIYGPCNRILSHPESDVFVRKHTQMIQNNAEKLNDLIQELIEFRQIETGVKPVRIESVVLNDVSKRVFDSFSELAKSKNIELNDSSDLRILWNTDVNFLSTILYNIIKNMLGRLFDSAVLAGSIKLEMKDVGGSLKIDIRNNGKRMSEDEFFQIADKYKVFEDFEKNHGATNNLSMAIAFDLVQLLDGVVETDYEDGWNRFTIELPKKTADTHSVAIDWKQLPVKAKHLQSTINELPHYEIDDSKPTILIVDEDIEILWLMCEVFVDQYNVVPIREAVFPIDYLENHHPDMVICDITNGGREGIDFIQKMKTDKRTAHIPVILLSAKQGVEDQIEGLSAGAERYITKPFNIDYLKVSVEQLILRKDMLKDYFNSPLSAYDLKDGKLNHKDNQRFVEKIMSLIDNNITNSELSTQFVAQEMGISPRHLNRKMNQMGITQRIPDIIKECRLKMASNLLINTQFSVEEVIYKSGFSNKATFFKNFADKHNCTPKEFRMKNT